MTRQNSGTHYNEDHLRQGSPTNTTFCETIPRILAGSDVAIAATGVVNSVGCPFQFGEVVRTVTFVVGGTAASVPTAGFAAVYSPAGALLAQTADFGSTARAANTVYSVLLASAIIIDTPGLYYVAISFTATTVPTLRGATVGNAVAAGALGLGAKILSQMHGSAVGAVAPATIATPTTVATIPYLVCT